MMEFDIELIASTRDEGGIEGSLQAQLAEIGGTATLLEQGQPYRVDGTGPVPSFEVKNSYHIVLQD